MGDGNMQGRGKKHKTKREARCQSGSLLGTYWKVSLGKSSMKLEPSQHKVQRQQRAKTAGGAQTGGREHAGGNWGDGWSNRAALLIGLPLCTWSVWPRKIERHSTANQGRRQNKMIIKKCSNFRKQIIKSVSQPSTYSIKKTFQSSQAQRKMKRSQFY